MSMRRGCPHVHSRDLPSNQKQSSFHTRTHTSQAIHLSKGPFYHSVQPAKGKMSEYYREEEEEEQQQLEAFDEFLNKKKDHFLITRILQLVFSVSIFSLVLCYSSSGLSFFPHSFNVYFSTFLFSFFTQTLERKYMFLICNGILAFLAKSWSPSITTSSSSSSDYLAAAAPPHYQLSASDLPAEINEQVCLEDVESTSSSASACCVAADHKINGGDVRVENVESLAKISLQDEKEEEERELAAEETTQAKQKGHVEDVEDEESVIAQEEEDEEEEEEEEEENYTGEAEAEAEDNYTREAEAEAVALNEPSTDELNKKIEEFIRKMKEEIRIEAQRPLVAV